MAYPGSPLFAALSLRDTDTMHLAELHPGEVKHLRANLMQWGAHIHEAKGFRPPMPSARHTPRGG